MARSNWRLGVDIGGTFTDVVLEGGNEVFSTKVLTTYDAPENAILDGLSQVCGKAHIDPAEITQIIHGTTLATNALIERRGARTALITTEGFRDVIEMRTESRFEQYDLNLTLPEPLLPRQRRYTLRERVGADGDVLVALDRNDIESLADELALAGYDSVAIGFLHSYLNPAHERMVRDVLSRKLPDMMVSLSSDVSPQMREYERFNTTIANAYIKPLMKSYLDRLADRLENAGTTCPIFLMHSGGGIISLASAAEFPVRLVESGPAGGAVFAATLASQYGLTKVLSFDMGGTTAKICLIKNQMPKTARVFEVARSYRFKKGSGMPISIPVIDMVGPESAGSEPGPACYGRGGVRPAVTDADLVLGKLDPDNFAGGSMGLSVADAKTALIETLGQPLDMDAVTAAFGLAEVVDENMANAARVHAVENGEDLAEYTMIAFGGAAPLHAARLCEKLGISRCLIPKGAGVGSAIGFLRAPFSFEANRSVYMRLSDLSPVTVQGLFAELEAEATGFVRSCDATAAIQAEHKIYMRYVGQGWEIPVNLTAAQAANPDAETYLKLFEADYTRLFGRVVDGLDIEITVWSVNAATPTATVTQVHPVTELVAAESPDQRQMFDAALGHMTTAQVTARRGLGPGDRVCGPAIITEDETTIIIPASRRATVQNDGTVDIERVPA